MKLSIGIVGLPNVGKSTLFNAILKKQVANVANYPFCTIEPNVGVVEVPDPRLPVLAKIVKTEKIVPAVVEFFDIAGLVKGASQGEGLGNKFLSHIREVATIVHVVRLFEDGEIIHVGNISNPFDDIKIIESELILADLETLSKQKEPRMNATKEEIFTYQTVQALKKEMDQGTMAKKAHLSVEQQESIRLLSLLTTKPVLYAFNVSEKQLDHQNELKKQIEKILNDVGDDKAAYIYINAKLENEVLALSESEQIEYLKQFHLEETCLNRLIKKAYENLGLISFLTAGELEARAWTVHNGTLAPQAAGVIHTDFEKHFIKADVIPYDLFVQCDGWVKAREMGKVNTVGKDYLMKDGEVVEFKVGV